MAKYSKLVGMFVGAIVGLILNWVGLSESIDVPVQYQPIVDQLVVLILGALGTYFAPKNAPS